MGLERGRTRLEDAFRTPSTKYRYVGRLFTTIADRYDDITRILSFGRDQAWKRRVITLADIRPGHGVLDLACGTGDLALLAAARDACVIGLDLTPRMVELARRKPSRVPIRWLVGDMGALPFADASIDRITTGYGLRNVPVLSDSISEIRRVLRPGGLVCSLDFNRPRNPVVRGVYLAYLTAVGSALGWILHRDPDTYRYIPASIRRYPDARGVCALFESAGFTDVRSYPVLAGFMAIHVARR